MSTQSQVNASAYQYVLYYIGEGQKDSGIYPVDLSGICTLAFGANDIIECNDWTLGDAFPAPSNDTLLTYVSDTVLAWYANYYTIPSEVCDAQFCKLSTSALSAIRADVSMIGYQILDTTAKVQRIWNGASWAPLSSATTSVISDWSSASTGITFTANTPKVIDISGFTQTSDVGSEWVVNTGTGRHTYSGQTRQVRVTINYTTTKVAVATTQTLIVFISKNGSMTIGKRISETFVLGSILEANNHCISANIEMSTGDYVQLAGSYTATLGGGGIPFSDVSYDINGC